MYIKVTWDLFLLSESFDSHSHAFLIKAIQHFSPTVICWLECCTHSLCLELQWTLGDVCTVYSLLSAINCVPVL